MLVDVNEVIEGRFEPENMLQALEASVVVDDLQARVNKGKGQVFTYCLVVARNFQVRFRTIHEKGGWNDPDTTWMEAAMTAFSAEAEGAVAAGKIRFEGKSFKTFENAVRTLKLALERGCPLDERDEGTGGFAYGSKGAIEGWNKEWKAEQEEAQRKRAQAATAAAGLDLGLITNNAETGEKEETLLDLLHPEVREQAEEYLRLLVDLQEYSDEKALNSLKKGISAISNDIRNSLQALKKAANG